LRCCALGMMLVVDLAFQHRDPLESLIVNHSQLVKVACTQAAQTAFKWLVMQFYH